MILYQFFRGGTVHQTIHGIRWSIFVLVLACYLTHPYALTDLAEDEWGTIVAVAGLYGLIELGLFLLRKGHLDPGGEFLSEIYREGALRGWTPQEDVEEDSVCQEPQIPAWRPPFYQRHRWIESWWLTANFIFMGIVYSPFIAYLSVRNALELRRGKSAGVRRA